MSEIFINGRLLNPAFGCFVWSTDAGQVQMTWPKAMTVTEVDELRAALEVQLRLIRRYAIADPIVSPAPAEPDGGQP